MYIYHIVRPYEWASSTERDIFEAASLGSEGFIHCSFPDQIDEVIGRYFSQDERLLILKIDVDKLKSKLAVEPSTDGELFPHIYGPIDKAAIIDVEDRGLPQTRQQ